MLICQLETDIKNFLRHELPSVQSYPSNKTKYINIDYKLTPMLTIQKIHTDEKQAFNFVADQPQKGQLPIDFFNWTVNLNTFFSILGHRNSGT